MAVGQKVSPGTAQFIWPLIWRFSHQESEIEEVFFSFDQLLKVTQRASATAETFARAKNGACTSGQMILD